MKQESVLVSQNPLRTQARWSQLIRRHTRVFLSGLTVLARIPALLAIPTHYVRSFAPDGNDGYFQIAQVLVTRGILGFDSHHLLTRGPLFPLILAPGILLQYPIFWTLAVNLVASVGICLLVYEASLLWSQSRLAASGAALLVIANPWLIWCVKNPTPTVTATFFLALATYLLVKVAFSSEGKGLRLCFYMGVACGLGALDHPPLIALPAAFSMAIAFILWRRGLVFPILGMVLLWIGFAACLSPYTYRNFRIAGRFIPIADSGGFSYFMGTGMYRSSLYPVGDFRDFSQLAGRLHVTVEDLDVKFYTLDDRYYPLLSSLAKQDLKTLLVESPSYFLTRTAVMSLWFWVAGDKFVWITVAHCAYWLLFALAIIVALRRQGLATVAPLVVLVIPGMLVHGLSMPLIGYACYSIPYCAPLSLPAAIGLKDSGILKKLLPQSAL
jgi:hypothetical protein